MRRLILPSLSALVLSCVGDTPVTPTPDTGVPDTSTNDSSIPDTGGDAITDAGPKGWCAQNAPTALLCDDFDQPPQPKAWWSPDVSGNPIGTLAIDGNGPASSGQNAVRADTPAVPTTAVSIARFRHVETVGNIVKWTLEADVWLDSANVPDASATQRPVVLQLSVSSGSAMAFQIIPWTNQAFFAGFGNAQIGGSTFPFTSKAWHHVKMVLDRNGTNYTATNTVDTTSGTPTVLSGSSPTQAGVDIGLASLGQVPPLKVFIDNVVLTTN